MSEMEKFNLKTALSLLPVMKDDINEIQNLIDGIEYYQSLLDNDSKMKLVTFVLKSRLSQSAKLKLLPEYTTVDALITDMKNELLPKKSVPCLQKQLLSIKQNEMSIDDYGKQLAEMFVDLTLSQAGDNADNYKVLRPLNERQAIQSFADGLRNRRLSTIIAARNFTTLKDAVQAAIDYDRSTPKAHHPHTLGDTVAGRTQHAAIKRQGTGSVADSEVRDVASNLRLPEEQRGLTSRIEVGPNSIPTELGTTGYAVNSKYM
ncbi:uncharacterized protein LOC134805740 [Cydia splendana]|uniref:uncharacterized protein LOC134805726 n=1 Tax=Cydia splendana TaxID=1100963 RepID=UPI00300CBA42